MSLDLIMIAMVLSTASGLPALMLPRTSHWGQWIAVGMMCCGAVAGLSGAGLGLSVEQMPPFPGSAFPWPAMGDSTVGVDALSAYFLVPIFLMGGLGSIYGLGYWPQREHFENGRKLQLFWGLMVAGMTLLVISKHAMAFLLGWEVMALSAFFLVTSEDHLAETRQAGWFYLIAAHVGTLTLFALFLLWRHATGSYALLPVAGDPLDMGIMHGLFLLALLGFGLKAGVMPLHFWLPGAHANAPSHVSAMLSGVVLKMGIYGLVRFLSLLPSPPSAWGGLLLILGMVSGLLGVVFAISQHDIKRLLAYHSVENIGIILMGLGLAMLGRSADRPEWIVLGLAGCLLHVWNHGLFKSLLFLSAGSIVHNTHTRQIDHLGGLAKSMPWTAAMFLIGAVAICGFPPLNGFVSELLVYLGILGALSATGAVASAASIAAPVLAMIGALAAACFVKVYGAVFLGNPRTPDATHARESPLTMRGPMLVLAACCVAIGLVPVMVGPILDRAIGSWRGAASPSIRLATIAPLGTVSIMSVLLIGCIAVLTFVLLHRRRVAPPVVTWSCGYARPTPRMQYSASSFARMIMGMFGWVLYPSIHRPSIDGLFPGPTELHSHVADPVLDRLMRPAWHSATRWSRWFHRFQQGLTQDYVLYIVITVMLMLSTLVPFGDYLTQFFAR